METTDVLNEIRQIVVDEWVKTSRPVLLSSLPKKLEGALTTDYKLTLENKSLKAFLQENSGASGVRLVQDPEQHARVGVIPRDEQYVFSSSSSASPSQITASDAQAFARVLNTMNSEERRVVLLPASLVARLLSAR